MPDRRRLLRLALGGAGAALGVPLLAPPDAAVAAGAATSQLFIAGDPGNARDFLWRSLSPAARAATELRLARGTGGVRWRAEQPLVVGA